MIAAGMVVLAACSWSNPGRHPMHDSTDAAVEHYTDIPAAARLELKDKIARVKPDDIVHIYKDITIGRGGDYTYGPPRDMHFGVKSVCREVTMGSWDDDHYEIALVYCSGEHCVLVPRVCLNVSRVTRVAAVADAVRSSSAKHRQSVLPATRSVPEPSTWLLALTAVVGAGLSGLRKGDWK